MMTLSSINTSLFHSRSKVDLAPAPSTEQTTRPTALGKAERFPVRLGVQRKIFSHNGEAVPIITSLSGSPYLHAKSSGNSLALEDAYSGESVATCERVGDSFQISSNSEQGQSPIALVSRDKSVLNVVFHNETSPSFTIHKLIQHPTKKFQTKYASRI